MSCLHTQRDAQTRSSLVCSRNPKQAQAKKAGAGGAPSTSEGVERQASSRKAKSSTPPTRKANKTLESPKAERGGSTKTKPTKTGSTKVKSTGSTKSKPTVAVTVTAQDESDETNPQAKSDQDKPSKTSDLTPPEERPRSDSRVIYTKVKTRQGPVTKETDASESKQPVNDDSDGEVK